jgi:hypothetical protein
MAKKAATKSTAKAASKSAPKAAAKAIEAKVTKPAKAEKKVAKLSDDTDKQIVINEVPVEKAAKVIKPPKMTKAEKAISAEASEDLKKWHDMKEKFGHVKVLNYNLSGQFEAEAPINHKILGWGYVLSNQNDRLEVLFESGKKTLISNYKTKTV